MADSMIAQLNASYPTFNALHAARNAHLTFFLFTPSNMQQLLEQECRLNEWAIALKDAFVAAAREALLGSFSVDRRPALGISDETEARANLAQQPDYHDHREFSLRNTGNKIATCFESITVPAMSKMDYFRDSFDASLSKKWVRLVAWYRKRDGSDKANSPYYGRRSSERR